MQHFPSSQTSTINLGSRRFLALYLPYWATDYLKRRNLSLVGPLALYEKIKGGLRLASLDQKATEEGLQIGQNLADAKAMVPHLTVLEQEPEPLAAVFADFADWHSYASPMVAVMTQRSPFGDLILDITGVSHLFGGEAAMLRALLSRLRLLDYSVSGAVASTIGAAWAVSHFARSQVVEPDGEEKIIDCLPVASLRLEDTQLALLGQMGLKTIGQLHDRPRKPLQARFGSSLLVRLDQIYGHIQERMTPRLPLVEHFVERRFPDPIALMDDVLMTAHDLAVKLSCQLEIEGLGAQAFHLFLYRVDHKVMTLSINASRLTRDHQHISDMFRHKAQRLEGEYDAGFGIDMIRLAASSLDRLDATQAGVFSIGGGSEAIDQLTDRLSSRLGPLAVLRHQLIQSRLPERATRFTPTLAGSSPPASAPDLARPLRLLPIPEPIAVSAEVPDGAPISMIWRRQSYRLVKATAPERLGAEWWRTGQRLELVELEEVKPPKKPPYIPNLPLFDPEGGTRDYYMVEDSDGRRFWVYRQGFYGQDLPPGWYLHGLFA